MLKKRGRAKSGQKGGKTTLKRHGPEFYARIGRKGGKKRASNLKKVNR